MLALTQTLASHHNDSDTQFVWKLMGTKLNQTNPAKMADAFQDNMTSHSQA